MSNFILVHFSFYEKAEHVNAYNRNQLWLLQPIPMCTFSLWNSTEEQFPCYNSSTDLDKKVNIVKNTQFCQHLEQKHNWRSSMINFCVKNNFCSFRNCGGRFSLEIDMWFAIVLLKSYCGGLCNRCRSYSFQGNKNGQKTMGKDLRMEHSLVSILVFLLLFFLNNWNVIDI